MTEENDTVGQDIEHLTVTSFEPSKVQFAINDLDGWRKANDDKQLQIGAFIKIKDGNERSIVAQIQSYQTQESINPATQEPKQSILVAARPLGVLDKTDSGLNFTSGIKNISIPPQGVELITAKEIETMLSVNSGESSFSFGTYYLDQNIQIHVDGNRFFSHHVAIVGSTGSGKSGTVTKILQNVVAYRKANTTNDHTDDSVLNNSHILIFDVHGEYLHAFPSARLLTVNHSENAQNCQPLWVPYWLLNAAELESLFIETGENNAYNQIAQFKAAVIQNKIRWNPDVNNVDYDMPIYFSIQEVFQYIKNKNFESHYTDKSGKTYYATKNEEQVEYVPDDYEYLFQPHFFYPTTGNSNNSTLGVKVDAKRNGFYGEFTRFITRFQTKLNDVRLKFLLADAPDPEEFKKDPGLTYTKIVPMFFGHRAVETKLSDEANITIIDLSALPFEVVSIIVSVISRLAFEVSYFQTKLTGYNNKPLMIVYEEAHRYVPKNQSSKYRDTREAVERIAKEGRKYGISEMIVTQRPSEISPTVLSQCNNFVIMKLSNQDDQNIVRSILPDTDNYFTNTLSSLNRREALLVGDAMANTSIIKVDDADPLPQSLDVDVYSEWSEDWKNIAFASVVKNMLNLKA